MHGVKSTTERRANLLVSRAMGELLARLVEQTGLCRPFIVAPDIGILAALLAVADHPNCSPVWSSVLGHSVPNPAGRY
jgi:uncharacterized membrane protein